MENELRNWVNKKFFLDPPLQPKNVKKETEEFPEEINETIMTINKKILIEGYDYDSLIRKIVRDIVTIYKNEGEGEYYLPEDLNEDEVWYELKDVSFSVELILEES